MRAAIHSPYLDTLGGGERYVSSAAKVLHDNGWSVYIESKDPGIVEKLSKKFGLDLDGIGVVDSIGRGSGYDLCFWLSDGSIPTLLARKNILHFQRPFWGVDGKNLLSRMKFFRINNVVVNSRFTKEWVDNEYPVDSTVLYPPVDVSKFKPKKKENLILYVGRFSQLEQSKGQDVLLSAFKRFYDEVGRSGGWQMVLAGGNEVGRTDFVDKLKRNAITYPVKVLENPSFNELKDLYGRAKIYWSASGFGVNERREPNKVEHFGITVVEAMAAGCVPIIYGAGGHREIISEGENGFLWSKISELIKKTKKLVASPRVLSNMSKTAKEASLRYSYANFEKQLLATI